MALRDRPIPNTALCIAMACERRAIKIASPRASIRLTVSTTSAVMGEAVAPRVANAIPTSAAVSAGAVFTPSPTTIVGPFRDSSATISSVAAGAPHEDPPLGACWFFADPECLPAHLRAYADNPSAVVNP